MVSAELDYPKSIYIGAPYSSSELNLAYRESARPSGNEKAYSSFDQPLTVLWHIIPIGIPILSLLLYTTDGDTQLSDCFIARRC